jgi:3'-phosphoadenosine 5'-phosphosulfate sulfotransferase (PAPS reductase)/FAD synthetase
MLQEYLSNIIRGTYALPGKADAIHFIPVSGGADSTALAIIMHVLFGHLVQFKYLFTDTRADDRSIYENLDRLEVFLGQPIIRLMPEAGLYELIEQYNGFLPNTQSRWCTRELKLAPYDAYMKTIRKGGEEVYSYVGIRADESSRVAFISHDVITETPLRDLGIDRAGVFGILQRSVGVPSLYRGRTRSGCECCYAQRRTEWLATVRRDREATKRIAKCEKLSEQDAARHPDNALPIWKEAGLAVNHLTFPLPAAVWESPVNAALEQDKEGCRDTATQVQADLFGEVIPQQASQQPAKRSNIIKLSSKRQKRQLGVFDTEQMNGLWVGVEFFVNLNVGGKGVWWQEFVTFGSSRAGLEKQLQNHYEHRIQTPEVYGLDEEGMKHELRLAIYYIEAPASMMDVDGTGKGSFTWHGGESIQQLKHLHGWAERTLHAEGLRQNIADYANAKENTWCYEQLEGAKLAFSKITEPVGQVVGMDWFYPSDEIKEDFDEHYVACPMCSI